MLHPYMSSPLSKLRMDIPSVFSFSASYRQYHKLYSTYVIVPVSSISIAAPMRAALTCRAGILRQVGAMIRIYDTIYRGRHVTLPRMYIKMNLKCIP